MFKKGKSTSAYLLFLILCLVWGSSFILMKLGMFSTVDGSPLLTPLQLASIRLTSASLVMLPAGLRYYREFLHDKKKWLIVATAMIGTFLPAILFCLAEAGISSSLAGTINATTPLFTLVVAAVIFRKKTKMSQWLGIFLGLTGCVLLFTMKGITPPKHVSFALLVLIAAVCYGFNTNIAREKFGYLPAFRLSAMALSSMFLPSLILLWWSGLPAVHWTDDGIGTALLAGLALGVLGTALATILFYSLVKKAGAVMASMVTYGIPFVATAWGLYFGETVSIWQIVALCIILAGVFTAGRSPKKDKSH